MDLKAIAQMLSMQLMMKSSKIKLLKKKKVTSFLRFLKLNHGSQIIMKLKLKNTNLSRKKLREFTTQ